MSRFPAAHYIFFLTAAALISSLASGDDWSQYRGPYRTGIAPGITLKSEWPERLKEKWKIPLGDGFSSPAVAGKKVFVLTQDGQKETVLCLDAETGKEIWRYGYLAFFGCSWGDGPRVTPTVDKERVYTIGGTGEMYCLNTGSGKVIWNVSFKQSFSFRTPIYGYSSSPLIDGERIIVHVGGKKGNSVVAMEKKTGTVIWKTLSDPPGYASVMMVPGSPLRGPKQLVVFTEKGVVSLNPDSGGLFWRYPWTTSYEQNIAQPVLHKDILAICSLTGTAGLKLVINEGKPSFKTAWQNYSMAPHFSCPIGYKGYLYGTHGRIPELRCVDISTGKVMWEASRMGRQRAGIVCADGKLLVYTDRGELIVAEASPKQYKELARFKVAGRNWVPPVCAQGCLFIRDDSSLRCLELPVVKK